MAYNHETHKFINFVFSIFVRCFAVCHFITYSQAPLTSASYMSALCQVPCRTFQQALSLSALRLFYLQYPHLILSGLLMSCIPSSCTYSHFLRNKGCLLVCLPFGYTSTHQALSSQAAGEPLYEFPLSVLI